ncbi:gamma carbonic anhydrase family protein [Sphingomonas oryzagri]|uniref:Gamma carbonic anhydrase family protein n=1 Tax=Sphingomonas oryzagri TaxID=3042314 RepID=A0ABT6MVU9_9SPHN|nr:gamma carbonic anhydrase family protein [Sphingomonas oryzagri]MDH7637110.1 gamma carbonic anhydrase family protein [Sphingomonas oryzagri]
MRADSGGYGGGQVFALGDLVPRIAHDVFLAPGVVVIGDVEIGPGSSIWFNCVLRGDADAIRIGARSNIQDGSVIHADKGFPTIIGDDVLVGHMVMLHGGVVADRGFVGMGATMLNGARVEGDGMLGAGALLTGGKIVGARELWAGRPARFVRELDDAAIADMIAGTRRYAERAQQYRHGLMPI